MVRCPDFLSSECCFGMRELLQQQAAARDVAAVEAFQRWALVSFACFAVQWIQGPFFFCACSSALRTAQRHSWLRWHRPRSERSNPRSWTHYSRAPVITHPSRAYSISNNPAFVSHVRFGLSCVVGGCGGASFSSTTHKTNNSRGWSRCV